LTVIITELQTSIIDLSDIKDTFTDERWGYVNQIFTIQQNLAQSFIDNINSQTVLRNASVSAAAKVKLKYFKATDYTMRDNNDDKQSFDNMIQYFAEAQLINAFEDAHQLFPSFEQAIQNEVIQNASNVEEIIKNTSVRVQDESSIVIQAYGNIYITNSEITARSELNLKLASVMLNASTNALSISNKILQEAMKEFFDDTRNAKYADVVAYLNRSPHVHALSPTTTPITETLSSTYIIVPSIITLVVVAIVIMFLTLAK